MWVPVPLGQHDAAIDALKTSRRLYRFPVSPWWGPLDTIPRYKALLTHVDSGTKLSSFVSTVTTVGTPQDVALQEPRIQSFFPLDRETEEQARRVSER